ncbi:MAG: response regulator [Roseiflexaceae bacterium]
METPAPLRILLVEDDGSIGSIIKLSMRTLNVPHHLDHAYSAEEGRELWNIQPYDLLLTDYNLRGQTGLDLIQELKRAGETAPMMLFTAYDTPQLRSAAKAENVTYMTKPFFLDQFVDAVREHLPLHARNASK